MNRRALWLAGAALALAAGTVWMTWRDAHPYGDNDANNPHGIFRACQACGRTFTVTVKELAAHNKAHWGEPLPCPACGSSQVVKAVRCPKCKAIFRHDRAAAQEICPECKAPVLPEPPAGEAR